MGCALLKSEGVAVFMLSPKRVHDAKEVFDGVPSLHDAKSCVVMAQLHRQGVSRTHLNERGPSASSCPGAPPRSTGQRSAM
jgi:hypothetical protein